MQTFTELRTSPPAQFPEYLKEPSPMGKTDPGHEPTAHLPSGLWSEGDSGTESLAGVKLRGPAFAGREGPPREPPRRSPALSSAFKPL